MGKVLTINQKIDFNSELDSVEKVTSKIDLNGYKEDVETKVFPKETKLLDFNQFDIEYYQKINFIGRVNGINFKSILRQFIIPVYVKENYNFVYSIGAYRGNICRGAFRRLKRTTKVKCAPTEIDLTLAISCIMKNIPEVTVVSGWFSNLGEQLQNALLQGNEVNENSDWIKFKETIGSKLKNVEFKIISDKYTKGYIIFSLSSRGIIYVKNSIGDKKILELALHVVDLLDKNNIIKCKDIIEDINEDDVEENLYFD